MIVRAKEIFDFNESYKVAVALNPAAKYCNVNQNKHAYGGVHILFKLHFDSRELWIARIRMPNRYSVNEDIDSLLESSVLSQLYSHLAIGYAIGEIAERPSLYGL
jgi:hypothetical protein